MDKLKSPTDIIHLPSSKEEQDHALRALKEKLKEVDHPKKLDKTTTDQGMPAYLLNFYLATQVDLSWINLGKAVYIPVQITEREGGRKSIFFLNQGEKVLAGIYVTGAGLALRFVKRLSGQTIPAQEGDRYSMRITNRKKEPLFEVEEKILSFDPRTGEGHFSPLSGTERSHVLLEAAETPQADSVETAGTPKANIIKPADICLLWSAISWP